MPVVQMPQEGGWTTVVTFDGVPLQFCAPMGYPCGSSVKARYTPAPKAIPAPKATPAPKARIKPQAEGSLPHSHSSQVVEAKIVHPLDQGLPILPHQLPKWDGSWHWIRYENDEVSRSTRSDAAALLMETLHKGGFSLKQEKAPGKVVKYTFIKSMVQGTQILSCSQTLPNLAKDPLLKMELEYGQGITPMEKATTMVREGFNPACVNAASAYHRGGGFTSGGRHALEEAFCSQTTLYASLEKAQELWDIGEKSGIYRRSPGLPTNFHQHIPTDGCIVSPMVEIFRSNSDQGYFVHDKTVTVASVISVAMYNKNKHMKDAPVDAPKDQHDYEEGLRKKMIAMIHGAALSKADSIIIPDIGCGVFHNDPKIVGRICGEVLLTYKSYFKRAVFTGGKDFYSAASQALNNPSTGFVAPIVDVAKRGSSVLVDAHAHLSIGSCVQCGKTLEKADFKELALLIDMTKKSHKMQFLHCGCRVHAEKTFPQHRVMNLPDITKNAQSFLQALDLNGNGFVEKHEVRCLCALLWDGDVAKDTAAFEKDFEARWMTWDIDRSGNMDVGQIAGEPSKCRDPAAPAGAISGEACNESLDLASMSRCCISYLQTQAKKQGLS
jgi:uncharacterized protein (TIGR02452 family)